MLPAWPRLYQNFPQRVYNPASNEDWRDPNEATRRSKIYDEKALAAVVRILIQQAEGLFSSEIPNFFSLLLTNYAEITISEVVTRSTSDSDQADLSRFDEIGDEDVDHLASCAAAETAWNDLDVNERTVLRMRLEGLTDDEIATAAVFSIRDQSETRTGRWVFAKRKSFEKKIQIALAELSEAERTVASRYIVSRSMDHE